MNVVHAVGLASALLRLSILPLGSRIVIDV